MKPKNILKKYDLENLKGIEEFDIATVIKDKKPKEVNNNLEWNAEIMAFEFLENYPDDHTGWGTYFGPMFVLKNKKGIPVEYPSIQAIDNKIIEYWKERAKESKNPVLIARYSGLIWDFEKEVTNTNTDHKFCRNFINAVIDIALNDYLKHEVNTIEKLKRAINLAISLNDPELINKCKDTMMTYENKVSIDDKAGLWGYSFDYLVFNKKVNLSKNEEKMIINELEDKLERLSSVEDENISIWNISRVIDRLASYYNKKGNNDKLKIVLSKVKAIIERKVKVSSTIEAMTILDQYYKTFINYGQVDEANELLIDLRNHGKKVNNEMVELSTSMNITKYELDNYLSQFIEDTLDEGLLIFIFQFIPLKDEAEEQLKDLLIKHPFSYLFPKSIHDDKGRIVASVGPIKEDFEGNIAQHISFNMNTAGYFIRAVINKLIEVFNFNSESILKKLNNSPIIDENRISIIELGLKHYFNHDFVSSIHVLIPQIEEAIRNTLELNGGSVLKHTRSGNGYHLRTLDDILRDEILIESLGEDFTNYFRLLFTDQRGWNLRNKVCHGIMNKEMFNQVTADRVLHALLSLGLIKLRNNK